MLVNKTPHIVTVLAADDEVLLTIQPDISGPIRLKSDTVLDGVIDGIPISRTVFGPAEMPEIVADTYYVVSQLVKSAYPDRNDLLVPADVVRDPGGQIIGCRSLGR